MPPTTRKLPNERNRNDDTYQRCSSVMMFLDNNAEQENWEEEGWKINEILREVGGWARW
jgi:hypothetical protein